MKYGRNISPLSNQIGRSRSAPLVRMPTAKPRKGPRMPALKTPWGRISTAIPTIKKI
jgi:hypothetical protein